MVSQSSDKKPKGKPRGKPFSKGNPYRFIKPTSEVLDDTGHKISDEGRIVEKVNSIIEEAVIDKKEEVIESKQPIKENPKIIESISFTFQKNLLTILLKSIPKPAGGKYFKLQLILNDNIELKPTNFMTKQSALSFWNLLKGELQ